MRLPLVLLALTCGCTIEHGKIPVIDAFNLPQSVSLDGDGTYHVDATISYHDDDDAVSRIRVHIASLNATGEYSAPGGQKAENAPFTFKVVGSAPKGPLGVEVMILDVEGNASDVKSGSVTLK